jgi:hypothetical protein
MVKIMMGTMKLGSNRSAIMRVLRCEE